MGYDTGQLRIPLRIDNHLDERTERDRQAVEDLKREIGMLIDSSPAYRRIAILGVEGGR